MPRTISSIENGGGENMLTPDLFRMKDIDSKLEIARKIGDVPEMQRQLGRKTELLWRLYGFPRTWRAGAQPRPGRGSQRVP
jgi:hypothetical protein